MSKGKKAGNILVYGLMAMLIAGLGGFGISNFSGGGTTVATVGDRDITVEEYFRAMSQAVRSLEEAGATGLTLGTLEAQGIPAQVRGQLAGAAALNNEADRLGLSVGDEEVARRITSSPSFAGIDGQFDRESYEYMLDRNGWNVSEFERTVRDEASRQILQSAVANGVVSPEALVQLVAEWFGERRDFRWVRFDAEILGDDLADPTPEELVAYHEANAADFTLPEMKRITYALLTPDTMASEVEIPENSLRELYAERMDTYVIPERRLVERLVFGTSEEAVAAKQALDAGETDFEALVTARDLTLEDIDMGDVTRDALGQAADAVFGLEEPGVVGPYPSDLGPALFRMNAILSASETSFEDAEAELRAELGREEAREMIQDMVTDFDDRLAGGATLEDLAAETEMELGTIDFWDGSEETLAGYSAFREAAAAVTEQDFPEIITLDDGSIVALRLEEIVAPRLQELDEVRDAVVAGWEAERDAAALRAAAETAQAQFDVGGKLGDDGSEVFEATDVTRTAISEGVPAQLLEPVFELAEGESAIVDVPGAVLLVQLDAIKPADPENVQLTQFRQAVSSQFAQDLATDLNTYFTQAILSSTGITFDDAALNSVHSQLFR